MISFDTSLLTNYYNAKMGISSQDNSAGGTGSSTTGSTKTNSPTGKAEAPRAPWTSGSGMLSESDLVTKVMGGQRFINPNAVTSNVTGASQDYNKLFTLYQGLSALEGLATRAQSGKLSTFDMSATLRRFYSGMNEVTDYLADTKYDHLSLTEGTLTDKLQSEVGTARTDTLYTAPAIHSGSTSTAVKAFEGDVKFTLTAQKIGTATPIQVELDLSEMGTQTRSMSNVVSFINSKLKAANLSTTFAVNRIPAVPTTTTINGKSVTLSKGEDTFSLQIKGVTTEAVTLSAPATADSVYVVQTTGDGDKKITTTAKSTQTDAQAAEAAAKAKAEQTSTQLIKFQTDVSSTATQPDSPISKVGAQYWVDGESGQTALPESVSNVRATAAGTDGSVYVLADITDKTDGQTIKGTQDVALIKYDSAGNIVYTRTLGASDTASGYNLAISDDGKVAISGTVTGALDIGKTTITTYGSGANQISSTSTTNVSLNGADKTTTDSFVTVFDATGVEQWSQRLGSSAVDEVTSVAFGDDGSVYVGGRTQGLMQGADQSKGSWDGYVVGLTAEGKSKFTLQTGTANSDTVSQIAVDGDNLYVAGVENGNAVLKNYALDSHPVTNSNGSVSTVYTATLDTARDLGGLGGGTISGISVYNGKVYLGGSSGSPGLLSTGTVNQAYSGGYDAFALSVDQNLSNAAGDKVTFYGGAGTEKDAKVQFSDGKAWISGSTTGAIAGTTQISTKDKTQDGFLARLDVDTGAVEYQTRYTGKDGIVNPNAIAISKDSSSVLDRLGLPMGKIETTDSNLVIAGTSARTGDQFYLVDPNTNVRKTVTIEANDTLETLAKKITRASGYKLKVEVTKVLGKQIDQLTLTPASKNSQMEIVSGPAGKDALEGLGLASGMITPDAKKTMDASSTHYLTSKKTMGLEFDPSLNLNSDANIAKALESLQQTMKNLQKAYTYLRYGDPQDSSGNKKGKSGGSVPKYMTDQIANYQAALNRLTGGA
ncbi:MAG: transcriptional regulator [Asticcacaulis sp.]